MIPKNWPSDFAFSRESKISSDHLWLLSLYLSSINENILEYESQFLARKTVHPDLQIELITSELKYQGPIPHPLVNTLNHRGNTQRGIFAKKNITKGMVLGEYVGEMSLMFQPARIKSEYDWVVKIGDLYLHICPEKCANELSFVNDYRGLQTLPNVESTLIRHQGLIYFVYMTTRDVEVGQELLVDYGSQLKIFKPL